MGVRWTEADKARAVEVYVSTENLAEAQRAVARDESVPSKNTIRKWAVEANVDPDAIGAKAAEQTRVARVVAQAKWAQRRPAMIDELGEIAEAAIDHAYHYLQAGNPSKAKECALTAAISIDKAQVLSGDPSAIGRTLPWDSEVWDRVKAQAVQDGENIRPITSAPSVAL